METVEEWGWSTEQNFMGGEKKGTTIDYVGIKENVDCWAKK